MLGVLVSFAVLVASSVQMVSGGYDHFNGATMSFSVHNDSSGRLFVSSIAASSLNPDNTHTIGSTLVQRRVWDHMLARNADLDVVTGWVLGKGPCGPNCTRSAIGTSTIPQRKAQISQSGNRHIFGNWTEEYKIRTPQMSQVRTKPLNAQIDSNMTEVVLDVNERAGWEQERMKVTVAIEDGPATEDIIFEGDNWPGLTMQPAESPWHVQAKIDTRVRNDTGTQNRSPILFTRPVYRARLDHVTTIHIPATDPDGDFVKCQHARFVEAGAASVHPLPGVTVTQDCKLTIDADSTKHGYSEGSWGAIALTARDYNTDVIQLGSDRLSPNSFALTSTSAQFLVQVVANVDGPMFVAPTPVPSHQFNFSVGAVWRQKIYAKANENAAIDYFTATGRQQEVLTVSDVQDGTDAGVRFVEVSWSPRDTDVGHHIVCIAAVDTTGVRSDEDRCYVIKITVQKSMFDCSNGMTCVYGVCLSELFSSHCFCEPGYVGVLCDIKSP